VGGWGLDSSGLGKGPVVGSCIGGNEHSGSLKAKSFFTSSVATRNSRTLLQEVG
jgi:hypothetical protein